MNAEEKQAIRERWELKKNVGQLCNGIKPLTDQFRWTPYKQDEEDVSRLLNALDAAEYLKRENEKLSDSLKYHAPKVYELKEENQRLQKLLETCRRFLIRGLDEGFINDPQGNSVWIIEQIQSLAGEESK